MKIMTDTARIAGNAVGSYFQPIKEHPVLCAVAAAALAATSFAFEFGVKGSSSVEPSRNRTPTSAEKPEVLPNLDSLSPMGEGDRDSD